MADECSVKLANVWFNKFIDNYFKIMYGRSSVKNIFKFGGMMAG